MKPTFHTQYRPLTSRPFLHGHSYSEYAPCGQLAPYVACFWEAGSEGEAGAAMDQKVRVIPDTCVDIIVEINQTRGSIKSRICGLADSTVFVKQGPAWGKTATFAVRFYFWAVRFFLDVKVRELYNQTLDLRMIAPRESREFEALIYMADTGERIAWMENYLMTKLLKISAENPYNANVYNAIHRILHGPGSVSVKEICGYSCVGQRQMERLFLHDIGISIKRTADLVRYQKVWRDIVGQDQFRVQDAVERYGFADQPHLLNEFKRFHGVTPQQAKEIALMNR